MVISSQRKVIKMKHFKYIDKILTEKAEKNGNK